MIGRVTDNPPDRLLVVMPTWLGDCVMATPTLAALRDLYPAAQITVLVGAALRPILDALPTIDHIITIKSNNTIELFRVARRIQRHRFGTAVLLPNSFRSALLTSLARIPRRVGYDRDGRSLLLTDRLLPRRGPDGYVPVPTVQYYLSMAQYLGATQTTPPLQLSTRPRHDRRAEALLDRAGYDVHGRQRLIVLNPGGNFGPAKRWDPDRFAALADRLVAEHGAAVAVTGSPAERAVLDRIIHAARCSILDLPGAGLTLQTLKSIIRRADLLITNDTGPRHMAAALGTAVVTIFGPTDPAWTTLDFPHERYVRVQVPCGPCQKKICPLRGTAEERRCMKEVTVDMVLDNAAMLLQPPRIRTVA